MARIKHIAIKVEDQEKTAEFYKQTFGMTEAWRGPVRRPFADLEVGRLRRRRFDLPELLLR